MVLGASLVVSDSSALDAPVSSNLSARSLVASDRFFSGGTTVQISLSDRVSLHLIHAPLNAAVSSSCPIRCLTARVATLRAIDEDYGMLHTVLNCNC